MNTTTIDHNGIIRPVASWLRVVFNPDAGPDGSPYRFRIQRPNGDWCVAYGSYDNEGNGKLDHAPDPQQLAVVADAIEKLTGEAFCDLLKASR